MANMLHMYRDYFVIYHDQHFTDFPSEEGNIQRVVINELHTI